MPSSEQASKLHQLAEVLIAHTTTPIDWEALKREFADAPVPMTDRERVEALVEFANGAPMEIDTLNRFVGWRLVRIRGAPKAKPALPLDGIREYARVRLSDVVANDDEARASAIDQLRGEQAGRVMRFSEGDRWRLVMKDLRSAISHGLTLAAAQPDLRQCAYAECKRFFFWSRTGGRRCCPDRDCAKLHDAAQAQQRMKKLRQGSR